MGWITKTRDDSGCTITAIRCDYCGQIVNVGDYVPHGWFKDIEEALCYSCFQDKYIIFKKELNEAKISLQRIADIQRDFLETIKQT